MRTHSIWLAISLAIVLCTRVAACELDGRYDPHWAHTPALRTIAHTYDPNLSAQQNGAALRAAVLQLQPGDRLVVDGGVYSVEALFLVSLVGSASAPIRIEAAPGATPVLTRSDAGQNVINIGDPSAGPARYLLLRGFEITGGSIGVRIGDCEDLWIDRCHIHHTGAVTVRASTFDTARLTITGCEIHHSSLVNDNGEGLYLGSNFGAVVARDAVIARNHVHHMLNGQGDGIELKQGSSGCVIAENVVHDTHYPGILVYGSGGAARNRVEGNLVYRTAAHGLQVQGEALVRNNVVFGGDVGAFLSFDHQAAARDLEVVHNTFITTVGTALRVTDWAGRPGMVIANNALYSEAGDALFAAGGLAGVAVTGNVAVGPVVAFGAGGFVPGAGLGDFVGASFDGLNQDVHPMSGGALLAVADPARRVPYDAAGATRPDWPAAGAYEVGTYGQFGGVPLHGVAGEPRLTLSAAPTFAGPAVDVYLSGAAPNTTALLFFYLASETGGAHPFAQRTITFTDLAGAATVALQPPTDPALAGLSFEARWAARDPLPPRLYSLTQLVRWDL